MTTPVTSVSAEATLTEIADLFATQSISGSTTATIFTRLHSTSHFGLLHPTLNSRRMYWCTGSAT